jgi:endonuclease YncB( thermonuclease family)
VSSERDFIVNGLDSMTVLDTIGASALLRVDRWKRTATHASYITDATTPVTYRYEATVARIVDGDTVWLNAKLWEGLGTRVEVRVDGVNTPESHGPKTCPEGLAAAAYTASLLTVGKVVTIETRRVKARVFGHDEKVEVHGRYLASITLPNGDSLAKLLIAAGHGVEYHGEYKVS